MQGILYEENSAFTFVLVTLVLGGWAAWRTGRAAAESWKPLQVLLAYALLLGVAVRFIHHALFDGTFLSAHYYLIDTLFVMGFAGAGFRFTRTRQMVTQYYWLYRKTSPFSWAEK